MSTPTAAPDWSCATPLPRRSAAGSPIAISSKQRQPPCRISPGNETHLSAFSTEAIRPDGTRQPLYLHTSPEFACKKLLAAGETRIFSFGKVWRNRERGPLHHPEFTMIEWYRVGEIYDSLMADCAALLALCAERAGTKSFAFRGKEADPFAEPERLTVADAFSRLAGIDLLATVSPDGATDRAALHAALAAAGLRTAADDSWSDLFSRVMVECIEPALGRQRATILYEYPIPEAALARPSPRDPRVAERFELYCCGVELANAFGELTDAEEQRRRFRADMDEKEKIYGERYPIDEDFLNALAQMPEASGIALGFDRLVMLATGARSIEDVLWTPVAEGVRQLPAPQQPGKRDRQPSDDHQHPAHRRRIGEQAVVKHRARHHVAGEQRHADEQEKAAQPCRPACEQSERQQRRRMNQKQRRCDLDGLPAAVRGDRRQRDAERSGQPGGQREQAVLIGQSSAIFPLHDHRIPQTQAPRRSRPLRIVPASSDVLSPRNRASQSADRVPSAASIWAREGRCGI